MKIDKIGMQALAKNQSAFGSKVNAQDVVVRSENYDISQNFNMGVTALGQSQVNKASNISSVISFTGGNSKQVAHLISEGALSKGGGVATVINDWIKQWDGYTTEDGFKTQHNFFIPYYNGDVISTGNSSKVYVQTAEDGTPYFVSGVDDISQVTENKGTKTPLKTVYEGVFDDIDENGVKQEVKYQVFEATENVPKAFLPEGNSARVFMVNVPKTAAMPKQYGQRLTGEYAYMGGNMYDAYTQFAKATVDAMEHGDKLSTEAVQFDPKNVVIHDWHPSAAAKFIQDKAQAGSEMYKDVNIGYVIHNIGRGGYQGLGSSEYDMFKSLATPEQFEKVVNSTEFKDLCSRRGPEAEKAMAQFWKDLMPGMVDESGVINPSMIPINLAKEGFVQMAGVSPGYVEEISTNTEYAEGLTDHLKALKESGHLIGITNGLAMPTEELQISKGAATYYSPQYFQELSEEVKAKFKYADGTEIKPMLTFNPDPKTLDMDAVNKAKAANKYNFVERIVRFTNGDIKEDILPEGIKPVHIVTTKDKGAKITSTLNDDTLKKLQGLDGQKPPKLFTSWGRGDFQKGIDELLDGIIKFVKSDKDDKNSIFVVCGGLQADDEGKKISEIIKKMVDMPELKGRFAFIDGWGPADAMASAADFAIFPSRFEPCGLTPQETYARGGLVIGANTGGMGGVKDVMEGSIIDYSSGVETATGFKTFNSFYSSHPLGLLKEGKKDVLEQTPHGKKFIEYYEKAKEAARAELELCNKKRARNKEELLKINDDEIDKLLKSKPEYGKAVREYRDSVMSDDISEQIKRAVGISDDDITKMRRNAITRPMDWHNNTDTNGGKSALQAYAEHFFKRFSNDPSASVSDIKIIDNDFIDRLETDNKATSSAFQNFTGSLKNIVKNNKVAVSIVGAAAALAVVGGAVVYHKNKAAKALEEQKKTDAEKIAPATVSPAPYMAPQVNLAPNTMVGATLSPLNQKYTMSNFLNSAKK